MSTQLGVNSLARSMKALIKGAPVLWGKWKDGEEGLDRALKPSMELCEIKVNAQTMFEFNGLWKIGRIELFKQVIYTSCSIELRHLKFSLVYLFETTIILHSH